MAGAIAGGPFLSPPRRSRLLLPLAILCCLLAPLPAQARELLRLQECGTDQTLVQVSTGGVVRGLRGRARTLGAGEINELLALVREGTAGMDQRWISAAANPSAAGLIVTDRPCVKLQVRAAQAAREVRWQLVPEPWNLASLKLHRLEQAIFGLVEGDPTGDS